MFMIFSESKTKKIIQPASQNNISLNKPLQHSNSTAFKVDMFSRLQNVTKCKNCGN